jgi:hypothetical protein
MELDQSYVKTTVTILMRSSSVEEAHSKLETMIRGEDVMGATWTEDVEDWEFGSSELLATVLVPVSEPQKVQKTKTLRRLPRKAI